MKNIKDSKMYTINLNVKDVGDTISKLDVAIDRLDSFIGDLDIYIKGNDCDFKVSKFAYEIMGFGKNNKTLKIIAIDKENEDMCIYSEGHYDLLNYGYVFLKGKYIIFSYSKMLSECILASYEIKNYNDYLKTGHWKLKRKEKLEEAGYKCQLCNNKDSRLNVHHNNYDSLGNEQMNDLIVLCEECHSKFHNKEVCK